MPPFAIFFSNFPRGRPPGPPPPRCVRWAARSGYGGSPIRWQPWIRERKDRSAAGGGVAILIKKEIAYSIVYTDDINAETVAITFKQRDKEIALATVYNPPGKIVELETLKHLTHKYEHCIITGDFNSKHAYFGNDKSDSAGDALFNITEELDLTILNDESVTFCRNYAGNSVESILDLALASRKMGPKVAECTVKGDVGSGPSSSAY